MLPSGNVIKEDDLSVLIGHDFHSLGSVTRGILVRIYVDDFSVSLVSEQQSSIGVGIDSEVRGVIQGAVLGIPVVVREV